MTHRRLSRTSLATLVLFWLGFAGSLAAATGGFSATLSTEDKQAAGVRALSADELQALDQLVADDVAFARREKLTELDGTFVSRLPEASRKQAGLDRLTTEQLAKLNELVAKAVSARPQPKERPRLKERDVIARSRNQIHGSVTVGYGWGRGGSARFGSLALGYYDPESRIGIGVGVSTVNGNGLWGYYPDYYYPGDCSPGCYYDYPGYAYSGIPVAYTYAEPRAFVNADHRGDYSGDFQGDGACLRVPSGGGFSGRGMGGGGGRRH